MKKYTYLILPIILGLLAWYFLYIFSINVHDKILGNARVYFYTFVYLNAIHLGYFVYLLYLRSNKRIGTMVTLLGIPPFPVYVVILFAIDFIVSALPL